MKYIIVETQDGNIAASYGPFNSHQEANHTMQQMFDRQCESSGCVDSDDSDASHFTIDTEDVGMIEYSIVELSDPEF